MRFFHLLERTHRVPSSLDGATNVPQTKIIIGVISKRLLTLSSPKDYYPCHQQKITIGVIDKHPQTRPYHSQHHHNYSILY